MNVLDLPGEVAESCLEMAIAISQAAQGDRQLLRAAGFVHRCYVRALTLPAQARAHDLRWRRFVRSLDAYLDHCVPSPQTRKLRSIVAENADLLDRRAALAS